jgi:oxygen-independent coproporphyrinogen-3 oxidase
MIQGADERKQLTPQKGGIYFHIPFCKQACHYCDFHFVTSLKHKNDLLQCMEKELRWRKSSGFFNESTEITSIYFGGGTPSLLSGDEVKRLLELCASLYNVDGLIEVTLEANPDDLSLEKLRALKEAGVNRLSIGVQSFFAEDLIWMNRAHGAGEAEEAIQRAQEVGITNITADLIYGYPLLTDEKWAQNISTMLELGVPHISAYSMTVEPKTALGTWVKKGVQMPMDEDQSARQFEQLMARLSEAGFIHYEISNWARPGFAAVHNSNYWKQVPYLGIGPSAHAFDGKHRFWNIANNAKYMNAFQQDQPPTAPTVEMETLSITDRFNEYIMTSLRTIWGIDMHYVKNTFPLSHWGPMEIALNRLEKEGCVNKSSESEKSSFGEANTVFTLTNSGKLIADRIASDLFFT